MGRILYSEDISDIAEPAYLFRLQEHLPPVGGPYWAVNSPQTSVGFVSLEEAVSAVFRKVDRRSAAGAASAVRICSVAPVPETTPWLTLRVIQEVGFRSSWKVLAVGELFLEVVIERTSRDVAVCAAIEFCRYEGSLAPIDIYLRPCPST